MGSVFGLAWLYLYWTCCHILAVKSDNFDNTLAELCLEGKGAQGHLEPDPDPPHESFQSSHTLGFRQVSKKMVEMQHILHWLACLKSQCLCVELYFPSSISSFQLSPCYQTALLYSWLARQTPRSVNRHSFLPIYVFNFLWTNEMWELKKMFRLSN